MQIFLWSIQMFAKGKLIRLGDRVLIANHVIGVVVFSIDTDQYSPEFPKEDWEHLGRHYGSDGECWTRL